MGALFVSIAKLSREVGMREDTFRAIVRNLDRELHGTLIRKDEGTERVNRDVWEAWRESQREPAKQWRANVDARLYALEGRVDIIEARRTA